MLAMNNYDDDDDDDDDDHNDYDHDHDCNKRILCDNSDEFFSVLSFFILTMRTNPYYGKTLFQLIFSSYQ